MITREQVADLRPGDVVEIGFDSGSVIRGPLMEDRHEAGVLRVANVDWVVRDQGGLLGGGLQRADASLAVVSRAPEPLYVNHDRSEPVPGDVAKAADGSEPSGHTWHYLGNEEHGGNWWRFDDIIKNVQPRSLRLLVDGTTGEVVQ